MLRLGFEPRASTLKLFRARGHSLENSDAGEVSRLLRAGEAARGSWATPRRHRFPATTWRKTVVTQHVDRLRKEHPVCLDDDALVQLLQIEHRLTLLREGLRRLGAKIDLGPGVVGVVARAAAGATHAAAVSDYLADVFGDLVRGGTEQECRRYLQLMRDFLFALEHAEDLAIDRRKGVEVGEEEWSIRGGRELIARVRGGAVEWLRFYCHVHQAWLPDGECEHSRLRSAPNGALEPQAN